MFVFFLLLVFSMQALFWQQQNYYGVDLTPLYGSAFGGYFSQVSLDFIFLALIESLNYILVDLLGYALILFINQSIHVLCGENTFLSDYF